MGGPGSGGRRGRPRTPLTENDERHGTINGYTNGKCRCRACKNAMSLHLRATKNPDKHDAIIEDLLMYLRGREF